MQKSVLEIFKPPVLECFRITRFILERTGIPRAGKPPGVTVLRNVTSGPCAAAETRERTIPALLAESKPLAPGPTQSHDDLQSHGMQLPRQPIEAALEPHCVYREVSEIQVGWLGRHADQEL